jgi:hypothetical protein
LTSSSGASRLRQVGPDLEIPAAAPPPPAATGQDQALSLLLLALKTISQRTLIALAQLAAVMALASVWWLFYAALPIDPSAHQLVGLGMYGVFVLAVLWIKR